MPTASLGSYSMAALPRNTPTMANTTPREMWPTTPEATAKRSVARPISWVFSRSRNLRATPR